MEFTHLMELLSWSLYTKIFFVLAEYGFYLIPFLIFLYQHYIALLDNDSNTSISAVSIKRMFNSTIIYIIVLLIAVIPIEDYSDVTNAKTQFVPSKVVAVDTTLDKVAKEKIVELKKDSEEIKIPYFFAIFDVAQAMIVGGVKKSITMLNIDDIRSNIAITMQNEAIKTPAVKRLYDKFVNECHNPALYKFQKLENMGLYNKQSTKNRRGRVSISNQVFSESYDWAGGSFLLNTEGFYKPCTSNVCKTQAKNTNIESPGGVTFFKIGSDGRGKIIPCDTIYKNELEPQLLTEFNLDKPIVGRSKISQEKSRNYAIRAYLKAEKVVDKDAGKDWGMVAALKGVMSWVVGLVGTAVTTILKTITTYLVTVIIPMIQALLLFIIIIMLPILLPFSGMKLEYLFQIAIALFSIHFVSAIIAVVSLVDNSLLTLMSANAPKGSGGFMQAVHIASSGGGLEFFLINLLILFFYLIAIKVWFGFMTEFGGKAMKTIGGEITGIEDMGIGAAGKARLQK